MFPTGRSRIFVTVFVAGQIGLLGAVTTTRPTTAQSVRLAQNAIVPDQGVLRTQEALVWTGYYEGPIDGSAGPGTQAAIKRFQHDNGKPETGSLDDSQAALLAQRAHASIQLTGYRSLLDARSGLHIGIPMGLTPLHRNVAGGSDYVSPDNQIQIGLRIFRTTKDSATLFNELKSRLETYSTTAYSVGRSTWFVLAGESDNRKYYLRYTVGPDAITGFFSVHDKSLPRETIGPYVAAVTLMSLTVQAFAADPGKDQIPVLTEIGQLQPVALSATAPPPQSQAPGVAPAQPSPSANDATVLALQRKIDELEAKRRQLELQLAGKTDATAKPSSSPKVDTPPKPAPQTKAEASTKATPQIGTPSKADSSGPNIGYGTIAVLVLACLLLVFFRLRQPSPAAAAKPATASAAPSAPGGQPQAHLATAEAGPPPQHVDAPPAAAAPATITPTPVPAPSTEVPVNGGSFNVVLVGGGMICLVFLLAFIVSKIATFTGFS